MIKVVTQILWFFQGLFTRMGVDFDRMLAIVTVKLTVDNRQEKYVECVDEAGDFTRNLWADLFLDRDSVGSFRGVAFVIPVVPVSDVDDEFYDGIFPDSF